MSVSTTYTIRNSIPTANSSTPLNSAESNSTSQTVPIGVIVGAALGGLTLVTLVVLSIFFWLRARRKQRLASARVARHSILDHGA